MLRARGSFGAVPGVAAALALSLAGCRCGGPAECSPDGGLPVTYVDPGNLCDGVTPSPGVPALALVEVASGLVSPVWVGAPPGDVDRLFIVEQGGRILVMRGGVLAPEPFLDYSARVSNGGEQGLLSVAFHPDYAKNGRLFIDYTDGGGNTVVEELRACSDPDRADPASARTLLEVGQPYTNHNGGQLQFGPDGYLYVALGDGGAAGDPENRALDLSQLLGKILRIDVDTDGTVPYVVPADNPFVAMAGAQPEIFIYGVRNPWRFSFDRANGDLYIGDVGQDSLEEIDVLPASAGGGAGANLGWDACEGDAPFEGDCSASVPPVVVYPHTEGCSVTGGFVYRGCAVPGWEGTYFYADYCTSFVRTFVFDGSGATSAMDLTGTLGGLGTISSFGEDARGEIYIADHANGVVYRIVAG